MDALDILSINNLRSFIIEQTLVIEEFISETLGRILDIDWKESLSFGYGSTSLSLIKRYRLYKILRD